MRIEDSVYRNDKIDGEKLRNYGFLWEDGKPIIGSVPLNKLDHATDSSREVEVINVKVDSGRIKGLLVQKEYYPAFPMNKKCWASIILDNTFTDAEIYRLIDDSYASV